MKLPCLLLLLWASTALSYSKDQKILTTSQKEEACALILKDLRLTNPLTECIQKGKFQVTDNLSLDYTSNGFENGLLENIVVVCSLKINPRSYGITMNYCTLE